VYAAFGAVWFFDAVRTRAVITTISYVGLIAAFAALQHFVLPIPSLREDAAIALHSSEYLSVAQLYAKRGQFDRAAAEMERLEARALERTQFARIARGASLNQANYRMLWAMQLLDRGQSEEARLQLERAAGAYGAFPNVSVNLYNLGRSYHRLGDKGKARSFFERFLALEPQGPLADAARTALEQLKP
jgi:tetratricopeptide (TPR) repeat protein